MKAIAIVDTSVLCEILAVPGKSSDQEGVVAELERKVAAQEFLFLSTVAVVEAGNHIGHIGDGARRRRCAEALVELVRNALSGKSPFVALGLWDQATVHGWLDDFPDWASRGSGIGDLAMKKDWERQCALNRGRRVYIWSLDSHLAGFDRPPEVS